jgi:hypothetical protein
MSFKIKSKLLKDAFNYNAVNRINDLSAPEASDVYRKTNASTEQMVIQILIGYVTSLEDIANDKDVKLSLDLTYGTVNNLPLVVAYGFNAWADCTTQERIDITAKSLAAYLMLMCVNEHNCELEITRPALYTADSWAFGWTGNVVSTGIKKKIDLLNIAKKSVKNSAGVLTIEDKEIVDTYKEMTDINLSTYGFEGIEVSFK